MTNLTDPIFTDENKAREHFEATRWPNGPYCPHCGETERVYRVHGKTENTRPGVLFCNACEKPFTVTVGTVMERSHVSLNKWALAFRLICSSKKGVSAHQLHRTLAVTYKTAWFMAHRIREAMRATDDGQLGGGGKFVEADETYVGGREANKHANKRTVRGGVGGKEAVLSLVERGGKVRSYHLPEVTAATLKPILVAQVNHASFLMTDEAQRYVEIGMAFAGHDRVAHSMGEYVRGEAHTNTVENYYSILKRGITGVYHHVSQEHLKRYLCEFDFRYNERIALGVDDSQRTAVAIRGAAGKRLTYQRSGGRRNEEIPF